jgi:phosphoenolpyruvate carboxylase
VEDILDQMNIMIEEIAVDEAAGGRRRITIADSLAVVVVGVVIINTMVTMVLALEVQALGRAKPTTLRRRRQIWHHQQQLKTNLHQNHNQLHKEAERKEANTRRSSDIITIFLLNKFWNTVNLKNMFLNHPSFCSIPASSPSSLIGVT